MAGRGCSTVSTSPRSPPAGKRWLGHSDFTAFQLAALAHAGMTTFAGPMAAYDFGAAEPSAFTSSIASGCSAPTRERRLRARRAGRRLRGDAVGRQPGDDRAPRRHAALAGIDGGILFIEDIGEQPYRVERMLHQLHFAGVLRRQQAVLLRRVQRLRARRQRQRLRFRFGGRARAGAFRRPDLHGTAVRPLSRQADAAGRRALRAHGAGGRGATRRSRATGRADSASAAPPGRPKGAARPLRGRRPQVASGAHSQVAPRCGGAWRNSARVPGRLPDRSGTGNRPRRRRSRGIEAALDEAGLALARDREHRRAARAVARR